MIFANILFEKIFIFPLVIEWYRTIFLNDEYVFIVFTWWIDFKMNLQL